MDSDDDTLFSYSDNEDSGSIRSAQCSESGVESSSSSDDSETSSNVVEKEIAQLRAYQEKLFLRAIETNLIISLPTNTGKTMIAVYLIRHKLDETVGEYGKQARRSFFLAPTRVLAKQQSEVLKGCLDAKCFCIIGDDSPDTFDSDRWMQLLEGYQVFVMTPVIFQDMLTKRVISFANVNVLVFDECHYVTSKKNVSSHSYNIIMDIYHRQKIHLPGDKKPRILALTATIFNGNPNTTTLNEGLTKLKKIYDADAMSSDVSYFYKEAVIGVVEYEDNKIEDFPCEFTRRDNYLPAIPILEEAQKEFNSFIKEFQDIYTSMGQWFASKFLALFLEQLSTFSSPESKVLTERLNMIKALLQAIIGERDMKRLALEDINGRIKALVALLQAAHSSNRLSAIVFVKKRIQANLIMEYLDYISIQFPETYGFIKAGFICGGNNFWSTHFRVPSSINDFSERFSNGSLNVLVATSVIEEGIDVPIANLVIRYDFPASFKAFVQSKGRARDKNSYFAILMPKEMCKEKRDEYLLLQSYFALDNEMKVFQVEGRPKGIDRLSDDYSSDLRPYETDTGAQLYPANALGLLNHYLSTLSGDLFASRSDAFLEHTRQAKNEDGEPVNTYAYCYTYPANSPLQAVIFNDRYFYNKTDAKRDCAMRACIELMNAGLIDNNLRVVREKSILEKHSQELNLKCAHVKQRSTNKKIKFKLKKQMLDCFNFNALEIRLKNLKNLASMGRADKATIAGIYLYVIELECIKSHHDVNGGRCMLREHIQADCAKCANNDVDRQCLGLALPIRLPNISSNPISSVIYFKNEPFQFKLIFQDQIPCFNEKHKLFVSVFHQQVMQILNMFRDKEEKRFFIGSTLAQELNLSDFNYYILPYKREASPFRYTIDFDLLEQMFDFNALFPKFSATKSRQVKDEEVKNFKPESLARFQDELTAEQLDLATVANTIFTAFHHEKPALYYIKHDNVTADLSNCSTDPFKKILIREVVDLFKKNHKLDLNPNGTFAHYGSMHVMLRHFHLVKKRQIILSKAAKRKQDWSNIFPLEVLAPYPLKISMFFLVGTFPLVFFRLHQFIVSYYLLEMFATDSHHPTIENMPFEYVDVPTYFTSQHHNSSQPNDVVIAPEDKEIYDQSIFDELRIPSEHVATVTKHLCENEKALAYYQTSPFRFTGRAQVPFCFNTFESFKCPHPWHIAKALTLAKVGDCWDMETMETVGDSFLKLSTTLYLFFEYPTYNEGKLDSLKCAMVSNDNLAKLALERKLHRFIFSCCMPDYRVNFQLSEDILVNEQNRQSFGIKQIADSMEAIIGTCIAHGSMRLALQFMQFLGLKTFDWKVSRIDDIIERLNPTDKVKKMLHQANAMFTDFNVLFEVDFDKSIEMRYTSNHLNKVEDILGYKFEHKFFLVQALTHSSAKKCGQKYCLVTSYERLEMLGDAILDYLVTYYIHKMKPNFRPEDLTTIRSALVNNIFLGSIAVKFNLHKYLICDINPKLTEAIAKFASNYRKVHSQKILQAHQEVYKVETEKEEEAAFLDLVDLPKSVADIFEALIGAVFIDCQFSLDRVWEIFFPLFKVELDLMLTNIPLNPKSLLEKNTSNIQYGQLQPYDTQRHIREVAVRVNGHEFKGLGQNRGQCELAAAMKAIQFFGYKK